MHLYLSKDLLGEDGKTGTVGTQLDAITKALDDKNGIQKLVDDATKAGAQALNVTTKFNELKTAVTEANKVIDEKLESGDLTQLDTNNLKTLKSSINDIQSQLERTFADFNVDTTNAGNIAQDKAKELLEALKNGVVASDTELGENNSKTVLNQIKL